jgi:hypothetical protein
MDAASFPSLCYPRRVEGAAPPPGSSQPLAPQAAADLAIDSLQRRFRLPTDLLYELCMDREVIEYRQAVLADVIASPELRRILAGVRPMLHELAHFTKTRKEQSSTLQQAVWRLGELETYVACLGELGAAAAVPGTQSAGMAALGRFVAKRQSDDVYRRLEEELPALRGGLKRRASVTIGVNLDAQLRPSEATLLQVHDTKFEDPPLLSRLFGTHGGFNPYARVQRTSTMAPLLGELERMLGAVARPLARALGQFVRLQVRDLLPLEQEIAFYPWGVGSVHCARGRRYASVQA